MAQRAGATWIDRAIGYFAPAAGLRRMRARVAADILARHYEAASSTRRTQGWRRTAGDASAVIGPALAALRMAARDLVRNNGHARAAIRTICDHVVGWGITAKPAMKDKRAAAAWKAWAETTACDADGRSNFAGLQKLVVRTMVESGEVLIRRRWRRPEDGLPIPMQLQVLDPDHIDTTKTGITLPNGGRIVHGVEFDALGARAAYWLFREHPGSEFPNSLTSVRIPAEGVLHVFEIERPSQVRGPSWFAPVLLKFKDFDDFSDATLMKQKIAACLAVITSDTDGSAPPLGQVTDSAGIVDQLEPGMILNVPPGKSVDVVNPPAVREYADYAKTTLQEIAAGMGISYEDLTGDYTRLPFSAARMSRLRHWAHVEDWRWRTLIPQFCDPVWSWAMTAAQVANLVSDEAPAAEWTAPPAPMIDPASEGLAYKRNIRAGIMTLPEALRERGYDPESVLAEYAESNKLLDKLGLILDSDPRRLTEAGNAVALAGVTPTDAPPTSAETAGGADEDAIGGEP